MAENDLNARPGDIIADPWQLANISNPTVSGSNFLQRIGRPFIEPLLGASDYLGGVLSGAVPLRGGEVAQQLGALAMASAGPPIGKASKVAKAGLEEAWNMFIASHK